VCYSLWHNAPMMLPAGGRQHRGCIMSMLFILNYIFRDLLNNLKKGESVKKHNTSTPPFLITTHNGDDAFLRLNDLKFIPLQNVVYFITWPFLVRKLFTFYTNDVLLFNCPKG